MDIRDRVKQFVRVPASKVKPSPLNWRTHPKEQADALRGVLADIGFAGAVLARELPDGSLEAIDGHLRLETMGAADVPVLVTDLTESEAKTLLATYDPLGAMAGTNEAKLDALLRDVQTGNEAVAAMLTDIAEQAGLEWANAAEPDALAEPGQGGDEFDATPDDGPTRTAMGDLWVIGGKHKILVGDCTDPANVARLMGGVTPFIMVTDPPYGVNLDQSWRDRRQRTEESMGPGNQNKVQNDDRADWADAYALFPGDVAYVWHAGKFTDVVMAGLRAVGLEPCQQLIWNKTVLVMGRSDYQFKHEPCWYAVRKGATHGWIGDRKQTTVIDAASPNHIMSGSKEEKTAHPTQKPIDCVILLLQNHAGDVYDPFLGSGTTLIAAHRLGRTCYGCELEPKYADVVLKRAEAEGLTCEKAG